MLEEENEINKVILESKNIITKDDEEAIASLVKTQREHLSRLQKGTEEYSDLLDHAGLMSEGARVARQSVQLGKDGFVTYLKDKDNKLIAYDVVAFDGNNVVMDDLGVDYESRGKGLGSKLLSKRHEKLREKGISEYTTGVHEGSIALLNKIKAEFEVVEDEFGNKTAKIKL